MPRTNSTHVTSPESSSSWAGSKGIIWIFLGGKFHMWKGFFKIFHQAKIAKMWIDCVLFLENWELMELHPHIGHVRKCGITVSPYLKQISCKWFSDFDPLHFMLQMSFSSRSRLAISTNDEARNYQSWTSTTGYHRKIQLATWRFPEMGVSMGTPKY